MWGKGYDPLEEFMREVEALFGRYAPIFEYEGGYASAPRRQYRKPFADLFDEGDKYVVTVELPGVRKEDIKLSIRDNVLYVEAESKTENREEEGSAIRMERSYVGFRRAITLPEDVIPEKARARYNNGILEVEIPKKNPTTKGGRTIPIE